MRNIIIIPSIIIGSGPAALTASIYLSRAKIDHVIISGPTKGGPLITSLEIENFPGFQLISGFDLILNIEKHAKHFGANIINDTIKSVDFSSSPFQLMGECNSYKTRTIIIATGTTAKKLGFPNEENLIGKGVSYCATCDGNFCRNKDVAIVGGGNTALEEALYLSKIVKSVTLIIRTNTLKAEKILQERAFNTQNINFIWNSIITELKSDSNGLNALDITNNQHKKTISLPVSTLFIAIGNIPNTSFLQNQIKLDNNGYIQTNKDTQTSIEGVFAAGDVQDPNHRQAIISAGSGAKAALEVIKYLINNHE